MKYDYSMLSMYGQCPKKFEWRIAHNLVLPTSATALEYGKCIHAALNVWYKEKSVEKAVEKFASEWKCEGEDKTGARTFSVAKATLEAYDFRYRNASVEMLACEEFIELEIGDRSYFGHVDKIVRWNDVVAVMDHKTTSYFSEAFAAKCWPNMQFGGYVLGAQKKYPECSTIIVDGILVNKTVKSLERLASENFMRPILELTPRDLLLTEEIIGDAIESVECSMSQNSFRMNTDACIAFNSLCPYRRLCMAQTEEEREIIKENEYKIEEWKAEKREM